MIESVKDMATLDAKIAVIAEQVVSIAGSNAEVAAEAKSRTTNLLTEIWILHSADDITATVSKGKCTITLSETLRSSIAAKLQSRFRG